MTSKTNKGKSGKQTKGAKTSTINRQLAQNRKARFEYHILETMEAGISLLGSEIKSARAGKININDSYALEKHGEIYLVNSHIAEYKGANRFNHEPTRMRKLLLHRKEVNKLMGKIKIKGYSLVPLSAYINSRNFLKIELALVQGKQMHDKRQTIKEREWNRDKQRILKNKR
ncbi:MAG: SsrA-binding protein SmpB [Sphingobacteriia bacterium]|nr:SsrA-binding protein SmpB [Sphingobacteriia bacterium]